MKHSGIRKVLMVGSLLLLLTLSFALLSCEPVAPLRIENQSDQTLYIYVRWHGQTYYVGDVAPGAEIKNNNRQILQFSSFPIEATNAQGNVVYSKTYTTLELMEKLDWKVVIPPLQK